MSKLELLEKLCPDATNSLPQQRQQARQQLQRFGLPGDRTEAWKYTPLRPLSMLDLQPAEANAVALDDLRKLAEEVVADSASAGIIVLAGNQCLLLQTPDWVHSFADLLHDQPEQAASLLQPDAQVREHASDSFIWMNLACSDHGVVIEVPANTSLDAPLHIIHADGAGNTNNDTASAAHRRIHMHCAHGASVNVIEHFVQAGAALGNVYRSLELEQQASLDLLQLRAGSDQALMIEHSHVLQQASSSCRLWSLDAGGRLMRQEVRCALQGATAGFAHHGLLLGHGRRHMDQHVMARHLATDCHSKQMFRSVLANRSRGVVNTAAMVARGADGSDVRQHCASILLSSNAEMDAKPQLEILADEVMASHGATIGQLDDDALFYLCSRGLSEQQARNMLLRGFVHAVLDTLPEVLRIDAVERVVQAQLEKML
jgi:Fe-S cluster assembly protein SufD